MSSRVTPNIPAVSKLVDRQVRNWELARQQRVEGPVRREVEAEDFICVSRQVGAGGGQVAASLGRQLGWPVFDREVLEAMSGDDEVRRQIYESMDERDLSWWEETLRSLMQSEFVRNDYFKRLSETLLSLARQGSCVFVGRGADLILPATKGFRVRIVAPREIRVERYAHRFHIPIGEARKQIETVEKDRAKFFRNHFGIDADDPWRYDITVNLSRLNLEQAVAVIEGARQIRQAAV